MTIATGSQALASDMLHSLNADGYVDFADSSTLTIATDTITVTKNWYLVDTEGGASSDNLATITIGANVGDGHLLVIRPANDAHTVVVKHNTGNILCVGNGDITLDDQQDLCLFIYDSNLSKWVAGAPGAMAAGAVTQTMIANGAVGLSQLAANSVDDTIAGNRVPQIYRRQGGSSTDWSSAGSTTQTPTSVRMQVGSADPGSTLVGGGPGINVVVTFPVAFSNKPVVVASPRAPGATTPGRLTLYSISATQFACYLEDLSSGVGDTWVIHWWAIGPE